MLHYSSWRTFFALQKELTSLATKQLVLTRRDGNRLCYRANTAHPLYPELHGITLKTSGIAAELTRALAPVQGIDLALIFDSVAAGTATAKSDLDLLVMGSVDLRKNCRRRQSAQPPAHRH